MHPWKQFVLNELQYELPNIVDDEFDDLKVVTQNNIIRLFIDSQQWMALSHKTLKEVGEQYSHFKLAEGNCICTGLGFLLRESWLLENPRVTNITVIERSESVIKYHSKHNPHILDKLNIVNCDVIDYKGSCDTLLLDHYEWEKIEHIKEDINNILKNIECKRVWFWPIEKFMSTMVIREKLSYLESYHRLTEGIYPTIFPELTEQQLQNFCNIYTQTKPTNELD